MMARIPAVRSWRESALLMLGSAPALVLAIGRSPTASTDVRYGVSRVDGDPGIAIHWVLCDGQHARVVDLEGYWGGSQLPTGVPVFWQIRSDATDGHGARVETYVVGETPPGFYETVPLRKALPDDLIAISGPPGDDWRGGGMTFRPAELRRDAIYRGGYEFVSPERFAADGIARCTTGSGSVLPTLTLVGFGLGGAFIAGRSHPTALFLATLVMVVGGVGLLAPLVGLPDAVAARQNQAAFHPGRTVVPRGREVLLELSPATSRPQPGGYYVGRLVAPDAYAFAVSCEGPSIHVSEDSRIEDGSTGSRQLIGCATGALVTGGIANDGDWTDLVEIVIDPNGMEDWSVSVVAGSGDVGPYLEH
jgi:hypothetical protein